MDGAAAADDAYRVLSAGEAAAASLTRNSGGDTWARWLDIGRAVEFVHGSSTNTREQGALIRRYPHLAAIRAPARSDAKWAWQHRNTPESLAAAGTLKPGHPTSVRSAHRALSNPRAVGPWSPADLRAMIEAFVQRHHCDPNRIVDAMVALGEACGMQHAASVLRGAARGEATWNWNEICPLSLAPTRRSPP